MTLEISRVARSKEQAEVAYDRLGRWYDLLARWGEARLRGIGLQMLAAQDGEKILEIGFGTGHALVALARGVGTMGKVSGIDLSGKMVQMAHARLDAAGLAERVALEQGDAVRLPYPDAAFDGVFMSFTLELFDTPEIPVVLGECRRTLREAGRVAVVALSMLGQHGFASRVYGWAHERFPSYADCRPIYLQRSLEPTGFVVAEARLEEMWGLPVELVLARKA
ncbi:MAG: class I SAM-dependent methyltransferase [Anaerolineae bacterium]